ncbi:unnamed protein product [Effrenium voratum]|uniref:Uncharacterized protein n=1 Tax=Effrenium voratum TaxID=2562239 RepID=A0AA36I4I8_9DINO|nr:unnamed protein product [Effrenium voratum]CAJ1379549.1 unnamed protein product [Effrenium voratum]CAJ1402696.1 unnamed protein product [Effrenium voratum]CAJ1413662.1 unnamed protein product [Effrenium voratum]
MSVCVDVPGYGSLRVGARTAGDVMSFLRARWPRCPWHGNKLLSCGPRQFHHDGIVAGDSLVLAKYSAINTEDGFRIGDVAERGITLAHFALAHLQTLVQLIGRVASSSCEPFAQRQRLEVKRFNFYPANYWIIKPATAGYTGTACSLVEVMADKLQLPQWFVSHAWIEPLCEFLACLEACFGAGAT